MKKIFSILFLFIAIHSFGQPGILPIGAKGAVTQVQGALGVNQFFQLPKVNTITITRFKNCDSTGILVRDSVTGKLTYMDATHTWAFVGGSGGQSGVVVGQVYVDSNVTAMLSHGNADTGAISVRVDSNFSVILRAKPSSVYTNWIPFSNGGIISFNGRVGIVIPRSGDYTTDSVTEGFNNLYYTNTRVQTQIWADTGTLATKGYVRDTITKAYVAKKDSTTSFITFTQYNDSASHFLRGNQAITLNGAVTGTGTTTIPTTLNSICVAGTYSSLSIGLDGRATSGSNPGYLLANQNITISGQGHGSGPTAIAFTLDSLQHLVGSTASPSISANSGAGTLPTTSLDANSTDLSGYIILTTGTSSAASTGVCQITFVHTYSGNAKVTLTPVNGNAAALTGNAQVFVNYGSGGTAITSSFTVKVGSTHLTDMTQYIWCYTVSQ